MAHPGLGVPDVSVVFLEALRSVLSWAGAADVSLFFLEVLRLDLGLGCDFGFGFSSGDGFLVKLSGRWINSEKNDESDERSSSEGLGFGVLEFEIPAVSFASFLWVLDLAFFSYWWFVIC